MEVLPLEALRYRSLSCMLGLRLQQPAGFLPAFGAKPAFSASQRWGILLAPRKVLNRSRPMLDITKDIQSLTTFRRRSGDGMKQLKKSKRPWCLR